MTEPAIYFDTMHGPLVGERWRSVEAPGWGVVEINHRQGRMVYARTSNGQIYGWGIEPFLRDFTRDA